MTDQPAQASAGNKAAWGSRFRRWWGKGRAIGLLLLIGLLWLRIVDPGFVEAVRLRAFDWLQTAEPRIESGFPVVIVDIDEASLDALGQWPWPRSLLAQMVDRLTAAGAAAIAFDVVFAEPDRTSPEILAQGLTGATTELRQALAALPANDRLFAEALARSRVVLGEGALADAPEGAAAMAPAAALATVGGDPAPLLFAYEGLLENIPALADAAAGRGFFSLAPEIDGVVRRVPLLAKIGDAVHPALAVEILRVATGQNALAVKVNQAGIDAVVVAGVSIPSDERGRLWIHFTPSDPRRYVSAADLAAGRIDPQRFAGRLVIFGTSATGLRDIRATPLADNVPGVEIQAQILETILAQSYLVRPNYALGMELVTMALAGLLLVLLVPILGARWTILVPLGVGALAIGGAWVGFTQHRFLIDATFPTFGVALLYLAMGYLGFVAEEKQKRQVSAAFGKYLSPVLVERLSREPDRLKLGGEQRELTVMFADIRGFTQLSERFREDPAGLTRLINRFLTPMSRAVLDHSGTIDKYIGDCLMAFWNAPLNDLAHQRNAALAALEMRLALDRLNEALASEAGSPKRAVETDAEAPGIDIAPERAHFRRVEAEALSGIAAAQYQLAKLYRDGQGCAADNFKAVEWFRRAALQGEPRAQRNLGARYGRGQGVARNDSEALFWLSLAELQELTSAEAERVAVQARLPAADIAAVQERVRLWRPTAQGGSAIRLEMGVGLNCGLCTVGNMGSDYRFDYSVLGDPVNLASRLEGQTRNYGVGILASESVMAAAPDLAWLELDLLAVKGKREAVRIYALLGDAALAAAPDFRQMQERHGALLAAYRAQDWAGAKQRLEACRQQARNLDELYEFFRRRIAAFEIDPPGADWNGVTYATMK